MTIRVGFDGAMLRAPNTGSGQYSVAALAALRAFPALEIVPLSPEPLADWPDAVVVPPPVWLASARVRKVWWEQHGVLIAAHRAGAHLIHTPYFAAPLRQHLPHVVTVHDVIPLLFPIYAGGRAMRAYLRLVAAGTRRAAAVITDSECSRRDAIRVLGLAAERVTTIPLAVGAGYGAAMDAATLDAVREKFGLVGKRVVFNQAGLDVRKNVGTLLRAFARALPDLGDDAILLVAGSAHGNPALYPDPKPLAAALGIAHRVVFPGGVTEDEKRALYHLAACVAAPSRYEGFGLTPLEAMACGAPVIAADASCTPEVVGDAALCVPPDDVAGWAAAIVRVLGDDALARQLRARGRQRAARFDWQATAAATAAVYRRALEESVGDARAVEVSR